MKTMTIAEFQQSENMPYTGEIKRVLSEDEIQNCKYHDSVFLAMMAKNINGNILEIGTSFGKGTSDFARNSAYTVYTVNPLPEQLPETKMITHRIGRDEIGKCYREEGLSNVVQIYANSKNLKLDKSMGLMLAFVDGNHTAEFAYADAVKCYEVLEVGGYLVWHDTTPKYRSKYRWIDTTMQGMERFCNEYQYEPVWIADTWCCYIRKQLNYEL